MPQSYTDYIRDEESGLEAEHRWAIEVASRLTKHLKRFEENDELTQEETNTFANLYNALHSVFYPEPDDDMDDQLYPEVTF